MKRVKCKLELKNTNAKNGSNIKNGKHRRAKNKRLNSER